MTDFHEVTAGGESDEIAPDPRDPDIVYGGRVDRLDLKSGQVRSVDPTLAFPDNYRNTWTLPLTWAKREHALLFGNQRIWRTDNGGQTWAPISPDLTRPDPGVPSNLDPVTAKDSSTTGPRKGVVYDIGPSPLQDGLIWAGTDDGLIWRTDDNGGHWANVTPAELTPWSKIGIIEPSHFDPNVAYAAIDRHRLEDQAPHILRTRDAGRSWQEIVSGLPNSGGPNSVNVVREDPVQRGLLFAGTERGLFVSFDDGDNWQPLQNGLPATSVRDITIHGDDLVIATHGRGFYVLDDIMALRSLAAVPANATRLYPIATAIRVNEPAFTGTPMPKDEPMGANPPLGAYIDYNLASPPSGPVTIKIFDSAGALMNSFSSSDPVKPTDLSKLAYAPEWVVSPIPPAATAGAHRFVWDLHTAPPAAFKDDRSFGGLWVPPGRYTVELDVDGQALRQPLVVAPDPRISVGPGEFNAQFQLARRIEQSRVLAHSMLKDAEALKEKLKGQPQVVQQIESVVGVPPPVLGSSDVATLLGISDRLDTLGDAVESADGAPSPDELRGYATLSAALNAMAQRWNALRPQLPQ
jgi:photosystem II stability/assembly factor-like uncharacterized protein